MDIKELFPNYAPNLNYIQEVTNVEPYEIWMKKTPEAADGQIYTDIADKNPIVERIQSTRQEITKLKNDPYLQAINGTLALGFIVIIAIVTVGFVIFWILSIRGRALQFGIFRAMGLSMGKINSMLFSEQLLISGAAVAAGISLGSVSSSLFTPLLKISYSMTELILPFKVTASRADYLKIYAIVTLILSIGFIVLASQLSRIRINQAIKLGED